MSRLHELRDEFRQLADRIRIFYADSCQLGSVLAVAQLADDAANICEMTFRKGQQDSFADLSGAIARTLLDGCPLEGTQLGDRFLDLVVELETAIEPT